MGNLTPGGACSLRKQGWKKSVRQKKGTKNLRDRGRKDQKISAKGKGNHDAHARAIVKNSKRGKDFSAVIIK